MRKPVCPMVCENGTQILKWKNLNLEATDSKKPQIMEWHLGKAGVVSKKVNHCVAFVGIFEVFTRCKFLGQGNRKSFT